MSELQVFRNLEDAISVKGRKTRLMTSQEMNERFLFLLQQMTDEQKGELLCYLRYLNEEQTKEL